MGACYFEVLLPSSDGCWHQLSLNHSLGVLRSGNDFQLHTETIENIMAPANNQSKAQSADKLKQKSLMSFFGKPSTSTPEKCESNSSKKAGKLTSPFASKDVPPDTSSDSPLLEVATPLSKSNTRSSGIVDATYTRSSDGGWSGKDTPPTSDPIDIDMLSDEDDGASVRSTAKPVSGTTILVLLFSHYVSSLHCGKSAKSSSTNLTRRVAR